MLFTSRIPRSFWNPWAEFEDARAEMKRWMSDATVAFASPPLEAWMKEDEVLVRALLPGATVEDVDLSVEGDTLRIETKPRAVEVSPDARWHRRERSGGAAQRTVRLPFPVASDGVRATLVNGQLEIRLARAEHDKPRRIAIQTG